jgi:hypothetical protein
MVTGFRLSAALTVAAELGLSDELAAGPRAVTDLAAAVSADPDTLHRLLRALATVGVYAEQADGTFALTELGDGLRSDAPGTLRPLARMMTDPALWAAWGHLGHSVATGENAFEALHGEDVWAHRRREPAHNAIFNANMVAQTATVAASVAEAYDFSGVRDVVDVAGGRGALLEAVLTRHGHLTGTVFDLPHVVAPAPSDAAPPSVAERWSAVSGSFFERVPSADCYLLKSILHDWPDDRCVEILQTLRRSLAPGGVVLVVELVIGRPGHEVDTAFSDLNMLVLPGGRERSEQEYAALFERAGLRLTRVLHTASQVSVLEAVDAGAPSRDSPLHDGRLGTIQPDIV